MNLFSGATWFLLRSKYNLDIKTIARKNAFWISEGKQPFNGLSDYLGDAWLVLYKEDYEKLIEFKKQAI